MERMAGGGRGGSRSPARPPAHSAFKNTRSLSLRASCALSKMRAALASLAALLALAGLAAAADADLPPRPGGRRARAGAHSALSSRTLLSAAPSAAAAAAAAAATSDRLAWMRDYGSAAAWATAAPPAQDVSVVLMTSHFFGAYAQVAQCPPVRGAAPGTPGAWNLTCDYSEDRARAGAADALW